MLPEKFSETPAEVARRHDEEFMRRIDHQLSEEGLILAGLQEAVRAGRISEDEKSEWLNEYVSKRNFETNILGQTSLTASREISPLPPSLA